MKAVVWWAMLALLLVPAVTATAIQSIQLDCGYTTATNLSCGDTATLQCTAATTLAGGGTSPFPITSMTAMVNGVAYTMSLSSGSYYNGTWRYQRTIGSDLSGTSSLSFQGVTVTDKSGFTCFVSPYQDADGCTMETGTAVLTNGCTCEYTRTLGAKTIDNRQAVILTPNAGCSGDTQPRTTYVWADYCDPQWTVQYTSCAGAWNGVANSTGLMTKQYYSKNPSCCAATTTGAGHLDFNHEGGASDCEPPLDNGKQLQCQLDVWPDYQDTRTAAGGDDRKAGFTTDTVVTYSTSGVTVQRQPLVFDMDRDGVPDIVVADIGTKFLKMYDNKYNLESSIVISGIATNIGQPALYGIVDEGGSHSDEGYQIDLNVLEGNSSPKIVVPYTTGSAAYVEIFNVTDGALVLERSMMVGTGGITGTRCDIGYCYFMTGDGYLHRLNPMTGSDTLSTYQFPTYVGGTWYSITGNVRIDSDMVPVMDETGNMVVWWWRRLTDYVTYNETDIYVLISDTSLVPKRNYYTAMPSGVETWFNATNPVVVTNNDDGQQYGTMTVAKGYDDGTAGFKLATFRLTTAIGNAPATMKWIWGGTYTEGDCVSNAVDLTCNAAGTKSVGVEFNVLTSDQSRTATQEFTAPSVYATLSQNGSVGAYPYESVFVSPSGEYAVTSSSTYSSPDYNSYIDFYDIASSTRLAHLSLGTTTGAEQSITTAMWDEPNKILWVATGYSYSVLYVGTYTVVKIIAYDYSDPSSIYAKMTQTYSGSPGSNYYTVRAPIMNLGSYVFVPVSGHDAGYITLPLRMVWPRTGMTVSNGRYVNEYWSSAGNYPVAYDTESGTLLVEGGYVYNFFDDFTCSSSTCPVVVINGSATGNRNELWNFQPSYYKFMTDDTNSRKVKALILGSETVTTLGCYNFKPLFYNADRYIFGTDRTTGAFEYCDFSTETNPQVHSLGLVGSTNLGRYGSSTVSGITASTPATAYIAYESGSGGGTIYIYQFDPRREEATSTASAFGRAVCYDIASATSSTGSDFATRTAEVVVPRTAACGPITRNDIDADGVDDIISIGGIASMGTGNWLQSYKARSAGTSYAHSWIMPEDLNGNYRTDLLYVSPTETLLKALVSNVAGETVTYGTSASLDAIRCVTTNGSNVVVVQLSGKMPDPEDTNIFLQLGGNPWRSFTRAQGPNYKVTVPSSGTYSINAYLMDGLTGNVSSTKSCTVTVTVAAAATCSLGDDGEFNYLDAVGSHGWSGTSSSASPVAGILTMSGFSSEITHSVSGCENADTVDVTEYAKASGLAKLTVEGTDGSPMAGFTMDSSTVYDLAGNPLATVSTGQYHEVTVEFSATTSQITYLIDGVVAASSDWTVKTIGALVVGGSASVDYVRLSTSGSLVTGGGTAGNVTGGSAELTGDISMLDNCNASSPVGKTYPNMALYCQTSGDSFCSYRDLQNAVQYNQQCMKEAYNYCVFVTYPRANGQKFDASNLQGGTVCMSVLGIGEGFSGFVSPVLKNGWDILTSNAYVALLLVILLIGVGIVASSRRR